MKNIKICIALLCLTALVSCAPKDVTSVPVTNTAASDESVLYEKIESKVAYSNLLDKSTQDEIKERLLNAGISQSKVNNVFDWINNFNALEQENLTDGYQSMNDGIVSYNHHTYISKLWKEKNGDYEDMYCRTVAFYLMEDFITVGSFLPEEELYLTRPFTYEDDGKIVTSYSGDKNVLDYNPMLQLNSQSQKAYYTLFNPINIEENSNVDQRATAIKDSWNESKIAFSKSAVSLVTIWNEISSEPNSSQQIFAGHAGVLIEDKEGLLFFEKTNPLFPYQVTKFETRKQLKDYMINTVVADNEFYGEETGTIFVMENNELLE